MPLWKKAKEHRQELFGPLFAHTAEYLKQAGFSVTSFTDNVLHSVHIEKDNHFYKLRNRVSTTLNAFSDAEIEEGIKELQQTVFRDSNSITMNLAPCVIEAIKL